MEVEEIGRRVQKNGLLSTCVRSRKVNGRCCWRWLDLRSRRCWRRPSRGTVASQCFASVARCEQRKSGHERAGNALHISDEEVRCVEGECDGDGLVGNRVDVTCERVTRFSESGCLGAMEKRARHSKCLLYFPSFQTTSPYQHRRNCLQQLKDHVEASLLRQTC